MSATTAPMAGRNRLAAYMVGVLPWLEVGRKRHVERGHARTSPQPHLGQPPCVVPGARQYPPAVSPAEVRPSRFLELLDEPDRVALREVARVRRYQRGAWLMRQGDAGDSVYVVLEGRAKVTVDTVDGRAVVLVILGRGDLIGEFEALEGVRVRSASIVALESMVVLVLSAAEFLDYLLGHPPASLALVRSTIRRLGAADRRRVGRTAMDSPYGLARF